MTPTRLRHLTLVSSITGAVIVALDGTVLTVAQPTLQRDLGATFVQVQWASTGYLIAVAGLLVFAGRLGDRYGHRRVFATGVLGFAVTSAGIGLATGIGWVIGLRVAQGVFGALLQPATLGMLRSAYPPDRLGRPIAIRTSAIGLAAAAGPVLGGALAAHLGWRAVFFLNVVPALGACAVALAVRVPGAGPEGGAEPLPAPVRPSRPDRLDLPGACLLAVALSGLVHTLVGLPESGWTPVTALGLAAAVVAAAAFVRHESRTSAPLVPSGVLRAPGVTPALGILVSASAAMFGALFLCTYYLQDVLALDPFRSGLETLPLAVTMVLGAPASAVLLRRLGARRTTLYGAALIAGGVFLMSRLGQTSGSVAIGSCFLLLGAGFGTVMVTATAVVVRQASTHTAGVAGGLQQTAMNIGPTLGVAAATMLMTAFAAPGGGAGPGGGLHGSDPVFVSAMGPTLTILAGVAAVGMALALRLPGRARTAAVSGTDEAPSPAPAGQPAP
ncbi:MFS transporter [Streptomyces paromomycinus]|uniref:MFS transporter n=1 Tax=Streptomyces paromomycinus TaxID=92743 RepID=A0A401W5I0_STREY|nr:MFS transporter [Streptomyces paromomycinus]GCD44525.1 MFS transporter [Streptomyces paromomycinus]